MAGVQDSGQPPQADRLDLTADALAILIVDGTRAERVDMARRVLRSRSGAATNPQIVVESDPAAWPFRRHLTSALGERGEQIVHVDDLERAFPAYQTGGVRLVLTQPGYILQKWIDSLERVPRWSFVATADRSALQKVAPDAFSGRGPWARFQIVAPAEAAASAAAVEVAEGRVGSGFSRTVPESGHSQANTERGAKAPRYEHTEGGAEAPPHERNGEQWLRVAYNQPSPLDRLDLCRRAVAEAPDSAAAWLALASACMEQQDLEAAREALGRAAALEPEWEAVYFELGKLWLRYDDMARASEAFRRAGELMSSFSAAFSNLGAALGELDRPREALAAFREALKHDSNGFTILNNVGVVSRELGRLDESTRAFRKVIEIAPDFIFGHYNLGHTLFLQGRYQEARDAYVEGQRRDPEKNARQASRLALARLAAGDPRGARDDLARHVVPLPADLRKDILLEAREIVRALLAATPDLAGGHEVAAAIDAELGRGT